MKNDLTEKQKRFCQEYISDLNATQAAIRAGYSEKTAKVIGCENLTKPNIQIEISKLQAEIAEKNGVSVQWVLNNFKEIVERCMQKTPVMKFNRAEKCMEQVRDENGEGIWQFDANGANRANELIGKHIGMFTEKLDVSLTINSWDALEKEVAKEKKNGA
jgi:phage terminase small subunit